MVNINNNISGMGVGNLGHSQTIAKPRTTTKQNTTKEAGQDFSSVLNHKNNQTATHNKSKQTQQSEGSYTYSPLMMRYGANKINEIKSIANQVGVEDLTNEDFDYAIRYGRSILADYIV
jgi:hypothetical protein